MVTAQNHATYLRLNVHVWISNYQLLREARLIIAPEMRNIYRYRNIRKSYYRDILAAHKNEQDLYKFVENGGGVDN